VKNFPNKIRFFSGKNTKNIINIERKTRERESRKVGGARDNNTKKEKDEGGRLYVCVTVCVFACVVCVRERERVSE